MEITPRTLLDHVPHSRGRRRRAARLFYRAALVPLGPRSESGIHEHYFTADELFVFLAQKVAPVSKSTWHSKRNRLRWSSPSKPQPSPPGASIRRSRPAAYHPGYYGGVLRARSRWQ